MELAPSSSARPSAPRRPMRYRYNPYATSARAVYVSCSGTDCEEAACLTPSECQHQPQQHLEHQQSPYPHVSVLDDGGCCGSETRLAAAEGRQQHQLTEVTTMDSYGHEASCIGYSDEVLLAQHAHDQQQKYVQQQQQQQLHSTTVPLFQVPALRRIHARQQQRMQHHQQQQYQQYQQEQLMASPMPPSPVGYVASAAPPAYVVAPPMATHHHVMQQQQQQRQYLSRPGVVASFPRQPTAQCSCCCGAAGSPLQYPHQLHQSQSQQDSSDPLGRIHLDHSAVSCNGLSQSLRTNVYQRHQRCATGMSAISGASTNGVAPYGMHHQHDVASLPTHFGSHSALDASTHEDCMAAPAASPSPTLTHFAAATASEYTAVVPMVGRLGGALRRRPSPLEAVLAAAPHEAHAAAVHPYHHHNSCGRSTVSADASVRSHHSASSVSSSSACAGTTSSGSDLDATVVAAPAATVAPVAMTTSAETSAVASGVVSKTAKKRQAAAARAARAAAAAADASNNATASGTSTDESPLAATAASAQEGSEEATKGAAAAAEAPTVPPLVLPDCLTVPWPLAAAPHAFRLSNVPLPEELGLPAEASGEGRYKQLCHGYTSAEYAKYRAAVPRHERQLGNPNHPLTPRADCASTRRAFRDLVFRWRQDLHRWDAMPDAAAAHAEGLPTLLEAGLEPAVRPDSPRPRDLARSAHLALGHSEAELRELGLLEL